jgi:ABC-type enterochelin transport system substrate-binding protein
MKFATISKSLVIKSVVMGSALLLASSALAATKANLVLQSTTTINGAKLKPGDYKLEWDGSGPNVEVSIQQGKKVIAKVPAKIVDLNYPSLNNAALLKMNGDGTSTLAGDRFEGKKFALEIGESSDGMQAGSSK